MDASPVLTPDFFDRDVVIVARNLLGMRLVRRLDGTRLSGIIFETEAYNGEQDLACHARAGRTARTVVMYGPAGRAYIYFTYGMHWLLNCVTGPQGYPAAVLLRGIVPLEGLDLMAERRSGRKREQWCNGPAKLCQALAITGTLNGYDLCVPQGELFIEMGERVPDPAVRTTPRVGINSVPDPWRSMPWRFVADLT
jgi:DNA-3-methyladenine glycosylase